MYNRAAVSQGSTDELTTRARIRDAAIGVFGTSGFETGVRAIATAAGVSPGLVNHHFGSKEGLRVACDERVLEIIRTQKEDVVTDRDMATGMLRSLTEIEEYAPVVAYLVRSFQAGGPLAESLLEQMVSDTELYIQAGVEAGTIKPSKDPAARARYITLCHLGAMVLFLQFRANHEEKVDYAKAIRELSDITTLPALEMYTQGFLVDPTILDTFIESIHKET